MIKPADVIQNKEDYIKEGVHQLSDQNFYIEVSHDLTEEHNHHVHHLVQTLLDKEEISVKCADYLYIDKP